MEDPLIILNRVINERGYLVIHTSEKFEPLQVLGPEYYHKYQNYQGKSLPILHPFVVIKETTREDRIEHLKACGLSISDADIGQGRFYQVTTD